MPRLPLLLAACLLLPACAALPPGPRDARDPLERTNRAVFRFNRAADRAVLRPAARAWQATVPRPVRTGLGNFTANLGSPVTILNDFLQGKAGDGAQDVARLVVNTVLGIGGLFDPATRMGLVRHDEDFGQTLGTWGVPPGPYLMLPLLGPSTLRDGPAALVDDYAGGRHYLRDPWLRWGLAGTSVLEIRTQLLSTDGMLDASFDPYALTRNAWLKRREFQVRDGDVPASGDEAPAEGDESPPLEEPPDAPGDAAPGGEAAPGATPATTPGR